MSKTKKIKDDCFALPKGVKWSPVDTALEKLRNGLSIIECLSGKKKNILRKF